MSVTETLMERDEWLDFRRSHVGGSDVAAIMGLSPWRTAYQVWAEKTGLVEPEDISDRPRVEWGTRLEEEVARKFNDVHGPERHWVVRPSGYSVLVDDDRPWAMATLDGIVNGGGDGLAVFEAKTAHFPTSRAWGESGSGASGVPAHYLAQVNHYLSVTGWGRAYVAVLIDGWDYREYVVERDGADVGAVTEAVDRFWHDHVEAGVPPEVTGDDGSALFEAHPKALADYAEGDVSQLELVEEWREATSRERRAKREAADLANRLKSQIGDAAGLAFPEGRLTWSRTLASRFDGRALKSADPDTYERYCTETVSQRLTWKDA